jgi:putative membrane protein
MMWNYDYSGPMMGGFGWFGSFHLLFSVFWTIVFIVLILGAIRLLRDSKRGGWRRFYRDPALDSLRERYAKGEIEKAEYEERRKVLSE